MGQTGQVQARRQNQNKTAWHASQCDARPRNTFTVAPCAYSSIDTHIAYHHCTSIAMAPVVSDVSARNNLFAYVPFGGHIALVIALTAHVLLVARRAAKSLPPGTSTRTQEPLRRNYAILFSVIAALSLASVATFAVYWRAASYVRWIQSDAVESPNALWNGWYGTGDEKRYYFGDWVKDLRLRKEADSIA
jgi:hypothetical protein